MPNPKGKPDKLEPHKFKSDRNEPLTGKLTLRLPASILSRLDELGDDKAEFCRNAIKKALDERDISAS